MILLRRLTNMFVKREFVNGCSLTVHEVLVNKLRTCDPVCVTCCPEESSWVGLLWTDNGLLRSKL